MKGSIWLYVPYIASWLASPCYAIQARLYDALFSKKTQNSFNKNTLIEKQLKKENKTFKTQPKSVLITTTSWNEYSLLWIHEGETDGSGKQGEQVCHWFTAAGVEKRRPSEEKMVLTEGGTQCSLLAGQKVAPLPFILRCATPYSWFHFHLAMKYGVMSEAFKPNSDTSLLLFWWGICRVKK